MKNRMRPYRVKSRREVRLTEEEFRLSVPFVHEAASYHFIAGEESRECYIESTQEVLQEGDLQMRELRITRPLHFHAVVNNFAKSFLTGVAMRKSGLGLGGYVGHYIEGFRAYDENNKSPGSRLPEKGKVTIRGSLTYRVRGKR